MGNAVGERVGVAEDCRAGDVRTGGTVVGELVGVAEDCRACDGLVEVMKYYAVGYLEPLNPCVLVSS